MTSWPESPSPERISREDPPGTGLAQHAVVIYSPSVSRLELLSWSGERRVQHASTTSTGLLDDAFSSLALGEQRIARALYDAQMAGGTPGLSWSEFRFRRRSLDDIARMKRSGAGWTRVFKQLKAEGVIAEQTLGHVVARWTRPGDRADAATPKPGAELPAAPSPAPSRIA